LLEMPADEDSIEANLYSVYDAIQFNWKPPKPKRRHSKEDFGDLPDLSDVDAEDLDSFMEELDFDAATRDKVRQEKAKLEEEARLKKQQEQGTVSIT
jgi:hypothetical protein